MGRNVILALGLRGMGAVAWFGYFWALSRLLPPAALGQTLYALALAGLGAMLASAGWAQLVLREGARAKAKGRIGHFANLIYCATKATLRRAFLLIMIALIAAMSGMLPPALPSSYFGFLTSAIATVLALIQIKSAAQRANHHLGKALAGQGILPAILPLGLSLVSTLFMPTSALLILGLHLSSLVLILLWLDRGLPKSTLATRPPDAPHALSLGQAGQVLLNHMDLLVIGWFTSPADAGLYLIARRLAGLMGLTFDALRSAVAPPLAIAFDLKAASILATQVNRLFLLTGLLAGSFLWLSAPYILPLFGASNAMVAFHGLLLGALTPAVFGATGVFMVMGDLERERSSLILALIPISLIALTWSSGFGITGLAFGTGVVQLVLGAGGAILLARRHNVRPGVFSSTG